jgi:hypothetical protein
MYSRFWTGRTARKLRSNPDSLLVAAYLCFGDRATRIGIYHLPICVIQHHTGLSAERVSAAMDLLTSGEDPFCLWDEDCELVWVVEAPQYQILEADDESLSESDKRGGESVLKMLSEFKGHTFADKFMERWGGRLCLSEAPSKGHRRGIEGASIPLRSQDQDQDQKQDQEQKQKKDLNTTTVGLKPDRSADVLAVFSHYRTYHPKAHPKPRSDSREWRAIRKRLDEGFDLAQLRKAIDGCHCTPHNLGDNDRQQQYLALELIVRSGDQVVRFAENADRFGGTPPPNVSESMRKAELYGQEWLSYRERKEQEEDDQRRQAALPAGSRDDGGDVPDRTGSGTA